MMRLAICLLGIGAISIGALLVAPQPEVPAVEISPSHANEARDLPDRINDVVTRYTELALMTPEPEAVSPEMTTLCGWIPSDGGDSSGGSLTIKVDEYVTSSQERDPHAQAQINVYMNPSAQAAFDSGVEYPEGSVIVKEKLRNGVSAPSNHLGGMIKRAPGYDPGFGDWEYFYGAASDSFVWGRMASCIQCHDVARESDHVYGTWAAE